MLFKSDDIEAILRGQITLAFRRWVRPTVKAGGTLRIPGHVLAIEAVEAIEPSAVSDRDARSAGRASREALLEELAKRNDGALYRIRFQVAGKDERIALRDDAQLTAAELSAILDKLSRMDDHGGNGAWTRKVLMAIDASPAKLAAHVAKSLGYEKMWFKTHVRQLKALGLTESLEIGYRLSPRGRKVLSHMK